MRKPFPWLGIVTFIVLLFVISPLIVIIPTSLTAANYLSFPPESFSFKWYEKILDRPEFIDAFVFSLELALLSAVIATLIGTIAAMAIHKYQFPGRNFINSLLLSPLTVPAIIIGIAALIFFSRIEIAGTFGGLLLAHVLICVPYVVRLVLTGFAAYDYTLERAAYIMGANSLNVFWDITLPLLRPAVISGFIFSFLTSFDNVTVSLFLVSPKTTTLPLALFSYMQETMDPLVASISSVVILMSVVFILILEKVYGLDRLFGSNSHSHS